MTDKENDVFNNLVGQFACNNFGCSASIYFDNKIYAVCGYEEENYEIKNNSCWIRLEKLSYEQLVKIVNMVNEI